MVAQRRAPHDVDSGRHTSCPAILRDGPTPKHAQLREILRQLVANELQPGSPVPSERDLAARYGVSRITVREAVGQLVADGLLTRVRGKGTFTARRRVDSALHSASFTQDMLRRGMRPETVVLGQAEQQPPPATASTFGLGPADAAYWLTRLRSADGVPMAVERGWYHPELVPGLLEHDLTTSLYSLLIHTYGVFLEEGTQTVLAEGADAETARLLGVPTGSPVLVFHRIATAQHQTVEDMTTWYRGDLYQVTTKLDRNPEDSGRDPGPGR